jgi:hypothetical protein
VLCKFNGDLLFIFHVGFWSSWVFWHQDNHPIESDAAEILKQKMAYLPVRQVFIRTLLGLGLSKKLKIGCMSAGDYYASRKGLMELSYV